MNPNDTPPADAPQTPVQVTNPSGQTVRAGIEYWELARIKEHPANPKAHDDEGILESIIERGFRAPFVLDTRTGLLWEGHGRLTALSALEAEAKAGKGRSFMYPDKPGGPVVAHPRPQAIDVDAAGNWTAPIVVGIASLNDDDAEQWLVASNQLTIAGGWDNARLAPILERAVASKVPPKRLGFDSASIAKIIEKGKSDRGGFRTGAGYIERKDQTTDEFYAIPPELRERWEKSDTIIVEYSGGKDSSSALAWAGRNKGNKRLLLAFANPGAEFPSISVHVRNVARHVGAELMISKAPEDWWAWIADKGWPSLLYRPCATNFIHEPMARDIRKNVNPDKTIVLTGSRAQEAVRGSKKTQFSELSSFGADAKRFQHFAPAFHMTKAQLAKILEEAQMPIWEGYEQGFVRTACWCCPGQCGTQAVALDKNYPGLVNFIRRMEQKVGIFRPTDSPPRSFDNVRDAGLRKQEREARKAELLAKGVDAGSVESQLPAIDPTLDLANTWYDSETCELNGGPCGGG